MHWFLHAHISMALSTDLLPTNLLLQFLTRHLLLVWYCTCRIYSINDTAVQLTSGVRRHLQERIRVNGWHFEQLHVLWEYRYLYPYDKKRFILVKCDTIFKLYFFCSFREIWTTTLLGRCGIIFTHVYWFCWKFNVLSDVERISKIAKGLTELPSWVKWDVFFATQCPTAVKVHLYSLVIARH